MTLTRPRLDDAACRGREDLYLNPHPARGDLTLMRKICESCWDRPECLAYALEHEDRHVWGGKTAAERRDLRREYGIEYAPILAGTWVGSTHRRHGEEHDEDQAVDG